MGDLKVDFSAVIVPYLYNDAANKNQFGFFISFQRLTYTKAA